MGWTSYHATHYKNGRIDRKAEIDSLWETDDNFEVLKSSMVGSTYYAAIKRNDCVFATIALTSVDMKDYFNFAYKDMGEDMGPYKCDCPKGILDLLTPTENEYANAWRKKCYENIKAKKDPNALANLPVGSEIKVTFNDGKENIFFKHPPAYQFKRAFWISENGDTYIPAKRIGKNYEVIKRGE